MKHTRIISFILLSAMLTAGCAEGTPKDTTDSAHNGESIVDTVAELKADIPEGLDYNEYEFTFLIRGGTSAGEWPNDDIVVEDEESRADVVKKAIFDRNLAVEELLNIKIVTEEVFGISAVRSTATQAIMSQDDLYDVILPSITHAATMIQEDYLVPLSELPYMDLSKPWYDQRCIEELQVNGDNYFFFSDITIRNLDAIWLYYFNKQMIDTYNLDDPYELVENGTWTMDKMTEMIKATTHDNGDGIWTKDDNWGLVAHDYVITASYVGTGERIATANADGDISLTMNNNRVYDVIDSVTGMFNYWIRYSLTARGYGKADPYGFEASDNYGELLGVFTSGNALFMGECMAAIEDMRNSDIEFGIVPSPKLDEEQDEYYSAVNYIAACMAVPVTNSDLERTSVVIEALAAESHDTLLPAYYETAIKSKYTRDTVSSDMLDLILDSVSYDLGIYYNWGNLSGRFCHLVYNGGDGFASMYAGSEKAAKAAIDEFISELG
ncbi:MAG: hypothetical protein IJ428_01030 [Clostridia bacterium]|nr:hypothetical protein [Clostridia bacterium]